MNRYVVKEHKYTIDTMKIEKKSNIIKRQIIDRARP